MEVLAIIPARGGSKGIPRKNLQEIGGVPLVGHSIRSARAAQMVSRVVVSTNDPEIAEAAERFGAQVVWRPEAISGDLDSSESALLHVLTTLYDTENYRPDVIVFLQCTSPLTASEDIDGAVRLLEQAEADSVLAVVPFHHHVWKIDADNNAVGVNHDKTKRLMRQQRSPEYWEPGAIYVMRRSGFERAKHRFFGKTALFELPVQRAAEIDDEFDLRVAQFIYEHYHQSVPAQHERTSS